ncbi:MAG: hypothetical protein H0W68_03745 [Gemmatimonadaceae bacterium]|nr:hypothetical protein [Gemmatimonadaceae bacterium]
MMIDLRRSIALAVLIAGAPALGAQSVFDSELRLGPQIVQYRINTPVNETITELALPVFVSAPLGSRLTMDVGTSYSRARVERAGAVSQISGLTDTQIRGNLALGTDFIVLTAGVNLPTGQSTVTAEQVEAAGRIGSDFLAFPISNMGTGLATTAGMAIARPFGDWNIGFGGAVRHSSLYEPFAINGQPLRFQPGDEYRARLGVDRTLGSGRVALGVTFSAFGSDAANGSLYNTGDRIIAQGSMTSQTIAGDLVVAAYNVFRAPGNYASGDPAGRENIANLYLSLGIPMSGTRLEPSLELRHYLQNVPGGGVTADRQQTSMLGTAAVRARMEVVGLTVYPSVGYTVGSLATVDAANVPARASLTGYRAQLAVRLGP